MRTAAPVRAAAVVARTPQKWWVQKASSRITGTGTPIAQSSIDRIGPPSGFQRESERGPERNRSVDCEA